GPMSPGCMLAQDTSRLPGNSTFEEEATTLPTLTPAQRYPAVVAALGSEPGDTLDSRARRGFGAAGARPHLCHAQRRGIGRQAAPRTGSGASRQWCRRTLEAMARWPADDRGARGKAGLPGHWLAVRTSGARLCWPGVLTGAPPHEEVLGRPSLTLWRAQARRESMLGQRPHAWAGLVARRGRRTNSPLQLGQVESS